MYGILLFLKYDTTYICMFQQYIYVVYLYWAVKICKYICLVCKYIMCINGIYFYVKICYVSAVYII